MATATKKTATKKAPAKKTAAKKAPVSPVEKAVRDIEKEISRTVEREVRELRRLITVVQADIRKAFTQIEKSLPKMGSAKKAPAKKALAKKAPAKRKAPAKKAPAKR